ncbi:YbdD/YjiX family protein [Geodermatophilus sp. SYSU D00815]
MSASPAASLARAWRGVRWYLREWSGEAGWDRYLEHCAAHGHEPMSRREFERRRADARERAVVGRCC